MIGAKAEGGERGCGKARTENGIYLEVGVCGTGLPFDDFLIDPPLPVTDDMNLTALGVRLYEINGVTHVLDVVGSAHYPSPADFLEEGRVKGFSRKVARKLDFSKLQPGSRLIFVHRRATVTNAEAYEGKLPGFFCPCGREDHSPASGCLGLHYALPLPGEQAMTQREVAGHYYPISTFHNPDGLPAMQATLGLFAAFPITSVSVVRGEGGTVDQRALSAAQQSGFPVDAVDQ